MDAAVTEDSAIAVASVIVVVFSVVIAIRALNLLEKVLTGERGKRFLRSNDKKKEEGPDA